MRLIKCTCTYILLLKLELKLDKIKVGKFSGIRATPSKEMFNEVIWSLLNTEIKTVKYRVVFFLHIIIVQTSNNIMFKTVNQICWLICKQLYLLRRKRTFQSIDATKRVMFLGEFLDVFILIRIERFFN